MTAFQISCLITSIASSLLGFAVFTNDVKSKTTRLWFLLSLSIAAWSISLFGVITSNNFNYAWFWQNLLDFSGIFIPLFNFSLILQLFKYEKYNKKILKLYWILGVVLAILSFTSFYKVGLIPKADFRFWVDPGPLYLAFPLFYLFLVLYSIRILVDVARNNKNNRIVKSQALYFLMASLLGFGGGATNFFPQFFNIYPFGNYLVVLYVCFIGYSIVKHGLFNIKVIATQLLTFAIWLIFIVEIFLAKTMQEQIVKSAILAVLVGFGVLLIRSIQKEIKDREEMEVLAKELSAANLRLVELDKAKSDFISIASHQLRTPLTAIKGYSSMLLEGTYGPINAKVRVTTEKIFESSRRLVLIIGDFLDISKIEAGKMQYDFAKFDLKEVITSVIGEFKNSLVKLEADIKAGKNKTPKKIDLTFEFSENEDFTVEADQNKIRQVVSNLIDNSIKYTPNGFVKVSIKKDMGGKTVLIKIEDSGIGMTQATIDKLFQKFARAEGVSKLHTDGSGLGLFVGREIIRAHGGSIWAMSGGEGKGSEFIIRLPVNKIVVDTQPPPMNILSGLGLVPEDEVTKKV